MSKPGHNSGPISADRLKSFIERIEKLEEERKAIGGDIKDVYSEAKGVGYDVATMRKIVALRAKDAADVAEQETLLDVYKHALGMLTSGTVTVQRAPEITEEELEERAGRIAGEVDRCMYLGGPGQMPAISAIQEELGCSLGKASKIRKMVVDRISREIAKVREMKSAAEEEAEWQTFRREEDGDDGITESCGERGGSRAQNQSRGETARYDGDARNQAYSGVVGPPARFDSGPHDTAVTKAVTACIDGNECLDVRCNMEGCRLATTQFEAPATPSVGAVASESERVAPPYPDDDPGPPPSFLRRTPAQGRAG